MVAGALANLYGNGRLHLMLKEDCGITALLTMVKSGNSEVIAQIARGMANFADGNLVQSMKFYKRLESSLQKTRTRSEFVLIVDPIHRRFEDRSMDDP